MLQVPERNPSRKSSRWAAPQANVTHKLLKKNTESATISHVKTFRTWQKEIVGEDTPLTELAKDRPVLIARLSRFIQEARSMKGEIYHRNTIKAIMDGVKRHLDSERETVFRLTGQFPLEAFIHSGDPDSRPAT
jgi:hypothetical protein